MSLIDDILLRSMSEYGAAVPSRWESDGTMLDTRTRELPKHLHRARYWLMHFLLLFIFRRIVPDRRSDP